MWWAFFPATNTDLLIVPIVLMGLATGFIGGTFQTGATYLIKGKGVGTAIGIFMSAINAG
jgi:riboflavin transporter FmnP